MDFFTYRISLDMNESTSQSFLNVRKSDSARKLLFTLSDNGKAYQIGSGCTAVFRAKKPDGTILYNNCSINGNVIEYELTNQTISAEGIVECEVTLYGNDGRQITSPRFNIVVNDTIYADDEVESQNEFTQLTQAILGANNLNIDVDRSGEGTVITITKKDGTSEQVIVSKVFFLNVFVITETEVVTNKTYAEIKAAIDAGDIIYITDKNGIVYVPQVGTNNTKIELLWIESQGNRTLYWTAVVDSENAWSAAEFELVDIDKLVFELSDKVDKETGKGLSTNDYTDAAKAKVDALAPVATSGNYNDLTNKPTIPTVLPNPHKLTINGTEYDGSADVQMTIEGGGGGSTVELDTTLSKVGKAADAKAVGDALAGKQNTISDLETIRSGASKGTTALQSVPSTYRTAAAQDVIDSGKVDKVTGKGLSTNDYTDAAKAKVDALAPVATSGNYNDLTNKPTIPAPVTEQTVSGWGFTKNTGTYSKPTGGIPKTDLASTVQTSLNKADTALQTHQSLTDYRTALAQDIIDSDLSDRIEVIEGKEASWDAKSDFSGSYNDLTDKPTPLTGTIWTLTPTQVYDAVSAGIPVKVQYTDDTYGLLSFTAFNIAESLSMIVAQAIVYYNSVYILAELGGNIQADNWFTKFTVLAEKADIPSSLKNPNALTIKIGSTTVTYDGSTAQTVTIDDGTEVSY